MSTDEYVPSDEELVDGYRREKVTRNGWTYHPVLSRAEIRRGLDRVRRDAARDALLALRDHLTQSRGYGLIGPKGLDYHIRREHPEETP